ncbi:unnamed protein product [Ceutorhynchus assimilis]|uniref:Rac GTPase-activating protein 1 n=1 Tax=Ceutorhynchus assimilis TaxID=467358 RepID=A0A9P0DDY7_9CUCU|nr:unnamed protein product [Ceutorhynchus assimilis]
MSDSQFKTPLSHHTKQSNDAGYTPRPMIEKSDSEESTNSEGSYGSTNDLTVIALFDDLIRLFRYKRDKKTEESFLNFAEESKLMFDKYLEAVQECQRLRLMLDIKVQDGIETERRVNTARHFLDEEKKKTQRVLREKEELEEQLDQVRELLFKDNRVKIGDDAKAKLSFLNNKADNKHGYNNNNLSCIQEINSTGSMLSDYSVSRSEDDLDLSRHGNPKWKKHRASTGGDPPPKKRRSSTNKVIEIGLTDTVRATTTVTVNKKGPITATSIIESIPKSDNGFVSDEARPSTDDGIGSTAPSGPPPNLVFESWAKNGTPGKNMRNSNKPEYRQHNFQPRNVVLPDSCVCCEKRIRFGKSSLKCKECRSICHYECKDLLPLPCVPVGNTPNHKNILGVISDYTPTIPPMVPALIVHCTNEIELRGLNELGLYRISASEKDVKSLKEKFLKGRGSPTISQIDIHVLCGCVKDFLRNLTEPVVTYALWHDFARAVDTRDTQDTVPALYHCISQLAQPNRDTLAYMIMHLQKISEAPECKMPIENLAKVFGPTLVGFSSDNPSRDCLLTETRLQIQIVDQLIRLPSDYWSTFINMPQQPTIGRLQQTPSTDSLLRPTGRFFTPKSKKRFATPPAYKNAF